MTTPRIVNADTNSNYFHRICFALVLMCIACGFADSARAQAPYAVTVQRNVAVKMRDGVTLYADVYRPRGDEKFPVLLTRTPYDKTGNLGTCMRVAAAGYVCVAQDVRGRFTSEGEWYPFKHESEDGYDTIEWLAHQPWSTGVIGMFGGSYVGATQMLAAIMRPPHLAGIFPTITASNYHENWTYQGGALEQWFDEEWSSGLSEDTLRRQVVGGAHALEWANTLPVSDYPVIKSPDAKGVAPYFQDWIAHPSYDDYWKQWAIDADYSRINIPAYHVGAWYDIFLGGTLKNYMGLKAGAGNQIAKENQRLLIEIGGHAGGGPKIGDVDFGAQSQYDTTGVMLLWYDYLFKQAKNGMESEKPVRVFTMGRNEWRNFDDWPPPGAQAQRMYLHSGGKANSSGGDGSLNSTTPKAEPADHYVYDPANPVQTRGGGLCCDNGQLAAGPKEQSDIEKRNDVLVFTSEPLAADLDATGPVSVELFVQSSAVDTDFTAKLVDLGPNGFAQNITDGILRMRYRNSMEKAENISAGQVYKITIDLWATSNVFLAGHRIRVDISSSNYPRFDRNLNTGETDVAHATKKNAATNTLLHDAAHPSALSISVLPEGN
jgi:putative CocE/NonD family hydrolase